MLSKLIWISTTFLLLFPEFVLTQGATPVNFKVAFIGDQGLGPNSQAVLQLILDEGAQAVMHAGDFDYGNDPAAWEQQIDDILGANFPYFAIPGEDDAGRFFTSNGYKERLEARMNRLGITWVGNLGTQSSFHYNGIFFVQTSPGISAYGESDHDLFIRDELAADNSYWRISTFHKNQTKMQLCNGGNAVGWEVYEESRRGGAITTNGQCHVYARTHLLSDMSTQTIASTSDTLTLTKDLPQTSADEGKTFHAVTGLGGRSIHNQDKSGVWWATEYSKKQGAQYGALFASFNYNGDPKLAKFYFKNIDGAIVDSFVVRSLVKSDFSLVTNTNGSGTVGLAPSGGAYMDGEVVTLSASPAAGWTFVGWSGDLTGSVNPTTITMNTDKNVTAIFDPPLFTLSTTTTGSGTVDLNPSGSVHALGTVVTLTAIADSGFTFSAWSGDVSSSQNPLGLTMDSDKTLNANFLQNVPPVVVNDGYAVDEDQSLVVAVPGVLNNDSDPDGDALQASLVSGPTDGALTLNSDGSFTYTPNPNYMGLEGFTYLASDGKGGQAIGAVSITVNPVNDAPTVQGEAFHAILGKTIIVAAPGLLLNDSDLETTSLTVTLESPPSNGAVTVNQDGSFSYSASVSITGVDAFTYLVHDDDGGTAQGTVTVSVNRGEIAYEQTVGGGSTDSPTVTTGTEILGVENEFYLAAISSKANKTVSSVSGLGLIWTQVRTQCSGRNRTGADVWMASGQPTISGQVTATFDEVTTSAVIAVSRYSGVDPVDPIGVLVGGNTNGLGTDCNGGVDSNSYLFSVTTTGAGSVLYSAAALRSKTHNPGINFTERSEISAGSGSGTAGIAVSDKPVALVSTAPIDGAFDKTLDWAVVGLEIRSSIPQFAINLTSIGQGAVTLSPIGSVYDAGTVVTLTATPSPEWTFGGWSGAVNSTNLTISLTMDADKSLTVSFDAPIYTLAISATGGLVAVDPPGNVHVVGTVLTLTATADSGRTFSNWSGDTTSTANPISVLMNSNKSIAALFPTNDPPQVTDDSYTVNEDDSLSVAAPGILGNDSDADGDPLTASLITGATNGSLAFNGDGSLTYGPNSNFNGADTLSYEASDGRGGVSSGQIVLTVVPVNDSPSAVADQFTVNEDDTLTVAAPGVLANDSDIDADPLTFGLVSGPANGSLTVGSDGSLVYIPQSNFNGVDTFTYQVSDSTGASDTTTVILTVDAINDSPVAGNNAYALTEDDTLAVAAPGLLQDDSDIDGDAITAVLQDSISNGSLTLSQNGSFIYIPDNNFNGGDTFVYRADDGNGGTSAASVTLTVNPANDAPIALDDEFSVTEDDSLSVPSPGVLSNDSDVDGDSLVATLQGGPSSGTVNFNPDGSFGYRPNADFNGADTLAYSVSDGNGTTASASFIINVVRANDQPLAGDDSFTVTEDDTLLVSAPGVLANDTDADSDPLSAAVVLLPAKGVATLNANGSLVYTPTADSSGVDFFTYQVDDANGGLDTASVTIAISPVNDIPVAVNESYSLQEDDSLAVASAGVLTNDRDADGDTLSVSIQTGPANGSLDLSTDGSFLYVPVGNFQGSDSFTYIVDDGQSGTAVGTVSLNIAQVNDPPLPLADAFTVDEDDTLSVSAPGVLSNDSDPEADSLTAFIEAAPANGIVELNPDGSFTYIPVADFNGADSFTYAAADSNGGAASATVTVTVNPMEDTPTAISDVYFVEEFKALDVTAPGVLENDIEPDGDTLVATLLSNPSSGTLIFASDGSFNYSGDQGFLGTDTFSYSISDGNGGLDTAQVSLTVNPEAVTYEETVTGVSSDVPVVSTPGPVVGVNGSLYLAAISSKSFVAASQVSGLGLTWTRVLSQCSGRNNAGVEIWMAQGLPTGNDIVTATLSGSPKNAVLAVTRYSGVDTENPIRNVISGNTNGLSGSCSGGSDTAVYASDFATSFPGSVVYGALSIRERVHTPGPGFTERLELHQGGSGGGAGLALVDMTIDSIMTTSLAGTFASNVDWALGGIEIKSGSTGGIVPQYTLTANAVGSGTIQLSPGGGVYEAGTQVSLTALSGPGWTFEAWSGDAGGTDTTVTVTVSNHMNVTATFSEVRFALTLSTLGQGTVAADPTGSPYLEGTQVALTATADSGWAFVNWSGDASGTANPLTTAMDSAKAVIANFEVNTAPLVLDDTYNFSEDDTLVVAKPGILANDSDADGDSLVVSLVSAPPIGSLSLSGDGSLSYIPPADSNGVVSFLYSISDGRGGLDVGTVNMIISPVNDPPLAVNDTYQIPEEDTLSVDVPGVLVNDQDVDGDTLSAILLAGPTNGSLNLNANGSFVYIPNLNFNGPDTFSYSLSDGSGETSSATVTIEVNAGNDLPVAVADAYTLSEDDSLEVLASGVLSNDTDVDGDTLTVSLAASPENGTITFNADGSFSYRPASDFFGTDSLTYLLDDGRGGSATGSVSLSVTPVEDAPVARNDVYLAEEFSTLDVSAPGVLGNDTDADGDILSAALVTPPANGTLNFNPDGSFSYTANPGFLGADSFTYSASDGHSSTSLAQVSLTVNPKTVTYLETVVGSSSGLTVVSTSGPVIGANGHLYLAAVSSKSFRDVTQVVGLGLTWSPVQSQCAGRSSTGVVVWMALGTPVGNQVVTATFASAPGNAIIAVSRYSGVDTDNPIQTVISGNTNGLSGACSGGSDTAVYAFDLDVAAAGSAIYAAAVMRNKTHTPGLDYDERTEVQQGTGGSAAGLAIVDRAVNSIGPTSLNGLFSATVDWGLVGIEIKSSSTGGVVPTYDLTVTTQGSGSVSLNPPGGPYESGTPVTLTVTPAVGWNFSGWSGDLSGVENPTTLTMDGDKSVTAIFTEIPPQQFSLTISTVGQGAVATNPAGQQHVEGTDVSLSATADSGWVFTGWSGDSTSVNNPLSVNMDSDKNITATFVENASPIAVNDVYNMVEDDTVNVAVPGILANDTDADGDALSVSLLAGPASGGLSLAIDGSFSYTSAADSNGAVLFTYSVSDGKGGLGTGTVIINIAPVNDPPVALNDSYQVSEDDTVTVSAPGILANDADVDLDTLTASLGSSPSNGSLILSGDGSFVYTPNPQFNGLDSFSYNISDGQGGTSTATVNLTVTIQNDLPVALSDVYTIDEDDTLAVSAPGVLANDSDSDGDPLSVVIQSGPTNGDISLQSDGSFTYTANANFNGQDTFNYTASDTSGGTAVGTVNLVVNSIEDPPVAANDSYGVNAGNTLSLPAPGVLTNDSDADGDNLTVSLVAAPTKGTLLLSADGAFTYTPDPSSTGTDLFTYAAVDGNGGSDVASVSIAVNPAEVTYEGTVTGSSSNVSQVSTSGPVDAASGRLYLAAISTKPFRQATGVAGLGLTWTRLDAQCSGRSSTGVELWMAQGTVTGNGAVSATLSGSPKNAVMTVSRYSGVDGDNPIGTIISGNTAGLDGACSGGSDQNAYSFDLTSTVDGSAIYGAVTMRSKSHSPGPGYIEQIEILQGTGGAAASLAIAETSVPSVSTTLLNGSFSADVDWAVIGVELKSGTVIVTPQFSLTSSIVGNGSLTLNPAGGLYDEGTVVAVEAAADSGWTFEGWSGDLAGNTNPTSLVINSDKSVTATFRPNASPVAVNDAYTVNEDDTLDVAGPGLMANDSDADGDALSVALASGPSNGTVTLNPDGSFLYLPQMNFNGTDTFIYALADDKGATTTGSATITVNPVSDAPIARDDSFNLQEGDTLTVSTPGLLTNDSDVDGDNLTVSLTSGPANGVLNLSADGSFSYIPAASFNGSDSFEYMASDGNGGSSPATVTLTITEINDPPVAGNDAYTFDEDTPLAVAAPGVLSNDSDADGDSLLAALDNGPSNGTLNLNEDGSFTYTPQANFFGNDLFTYTVDDGKGGSAGASVTLTVNAIQDLPVATDDVFSTTADNGLTVAAPGVLANDNDSDGDPLAVSLSSGPANGTLLNLNSDGSFSYTPNAGFSGTDSFNYALSDGNGGSDAGKVTINVSPTEVTFESLVTGGSSDVNAVSTAGPVTGVSGQLYLAAISTKSYRPATSVTGLGLTWTQVDAQCSGRNKNGVEVWMAQGLPSGDGIVTANLGGLPKNAIISVSRFSGVSADDAIGAVLSGNTGGLDASCSGGSDNNAYSFNFQTTADGSLVYGAMVMRSKAHSPGVGYEERLETLQGSGGAAASLVIVDRSVDLAATIQFEGTFSASVDWAVIGVEIKSGSGGIGIPQVTLGTTILGNGSISLSPAGGVYDLGAQVTMTAQPDAGWNFVGWTGDAGGSQSEIMLTMDGNKNVTAEFSELPPVLFTLATTVAGNGSVSLSPTGGQYNAGSQVTLTATPDSGWAFAGWTGDLSGLVNPETIVMDTNKTVHAQFFQNATPVAVDDSYSLSEDDTLTISAPGLLANDSDADGDPLSVTLAGGPSSSTVVLSTNGSFSYIPAADYNGSDLFTYSLSDGKGGAATGTVILTIDQVNDPPVAANDVYNLAVDVAINISAPGILGNDSDVDGDVLTASLVTGPLSGTFSLNPDGSFSYTPSPGFVGADAFSYLVSDGKGGTAAGNVSLAISPQTVAFEEVASGTSALSSVVATGGPLSGVDGHAYLAAISTKPFRAATSLSGLGLTWTRIDGQCSGRNKTGIEVWLAQGIASGDGAVTATLTSAPKNAAIIVSRYSGVDLVNPLGSLISGNTGGLNGTCSGGSDNAAYSFGLQTTTDGSFIYSAVTMRERAHLPGSGYTEREEILMKAGGSGSSIAVMDQEFDLAGSQTVNGSFDRDVDWALVALEIRPPSSLGKYSGRSGGSSSGPSELPSQFELFQNYPNPFNPATLIRFNVPKSTKVTLAIYDLKGRTVVTLVNENKKPGTYSHVWDARDTNGRPVASGVYFYRLKTNSYEKSYRMLLVR